MPLCQSFSEEKPGELDLKSTSNGLPDLSTANIILRSFRTTATKTTFPGLPAALSLLANSFSAGFRFRADKAGIYIAFLILEFPTFEILDLDLSDEPDSNSRGEIPQKTSCSLQRKNCFAADNSPKNVTAVFCPTPSIEIKGNLV